MSNFSYKMQLLGSYIDPSDWKTHRIGLCSFHCNSICHWAVTKSIEHPSKSPGSVQLCWCGFESLPWHKLVGKMRKKNPSRTICETIMDMSAGIGNVAKRSRTILFLQMTVDRAFWQQPKVSWLIFFPLFTNGLAFSFNSFAICQLIRYKI